jgi:hypothetical protein
MSLSVTARYVPDYRPSRTELRQARLWSIINIVGNSLLVFPVQLSIVLGWFRLYVGVTDHGWTYLMLSSIGAVAFAETAIYWSHQLLHARPFYGWFHEVHHRFREPTSLAAYASIRSIRSHSRCPIICMSSLSRPTRGSISRCGCLRRSGP